MKQSIKYVYDEKGRKYGVVVGLHISENTFPLIGVARCNMKADNFSKKKAVELAKARALKWGHVKVNPDPIVLNDYKIYEWDNEHLSKYLNGFTNGNEETKFMKAIDFVIEKIQPKEQHVTERDGRA